MQGQKETADVLRERRRGLPRKSNQDYSYLYYNTTFRGIMQARILGAYPH